MFWIDISPRFGILNCLYGAQVMHSEDMAVRALPRDQRLDPRQRG